MSWAALVVGAAAFAATNIDNFVLLVAYFSNPRFPPREIVAGQYLGISALILASVAMGLWALVVPPVYLGLVGFLPLGLGLKQLVAVEHPASLRLHQGRARHSRLWGVAAMTIANGGDNIGAYVPLFSTIGLREQVALVLLFWLLTGVCCAGAFALVRQRQIGAPLRALRERVLPWVLIGLGLYILVRNDALSLVSSWTFAVLG